MISVSSQRIETGLVQFNPDKTLLNVYVHKTVSSRSMSIKLCNCEVDEFLEPDF